MFGIENFLIFLATGILLNLYPGPDSLYIIGRSISQGRLAGVLAVLGIVTGAFVHTIVGAIGLSAILLTSAKAFMAVKYAGASYLIYQAVLMLKDSFANRPDNPADIPRKSFLKIYKQGAITNILNPKVALFFLSFLPQFIDPNHGSVTAFMLLGMLYVFTCTIWYLIFALFSSVMARTLQKNTLWIRTMNKISGGIFIGLGLSLALSKSD